MLKKICVLQENSYDCGGACLLSIIKYYGGYIDLERIRQIINTTKEGTNAYDLIKGSISIGLDSYAKKVTINELYKETRLPVIAHIKRKNMYHFVVIYKIKKDKLLIMDPSIGLYYMKKEKFDKVFLNTIIFFSKTKNLPIVKKDNKVLKVIISAIKKRKILLLILLLITLLVFIFSLLDNYYYKIIFDYTQVKTSYYEIIFIFAFLLTIKNIFMLIKSRLSIYLNKVVDKKVNEEVINNIFCLPYTYYKLNSPSLIVNRLSELSRINNSVVTLLLDTSLDIILLLITLIILFIINKYLALIIIIVSIVFLIITLFIKPKIHIILRQILEEKGYYSITLTERLESLETIRNLNMKKSMLTKINLSYKSILALEEKLNKIMSCQQILKNIIYDIGLLLFLTLGINLVKTGVFSLGYLMLLYMISILLLNLVKELLDKYIETTFLLTNIDKVNNLLLVSNKENKQEKLLTGNIRVEDLEYSYEKKKIFNKLNIEIKKGEKVLITGKSGCGKSTLIKIILKYITNYHGKVMIGEKDIKNINEDTIKENFIYIGQNERLYTDTFKNNIILGTNVSDEKYEEIINICSLNEVRNKRVLKDDGLIESGGFNYSGGERQRIILARALLNAKDYLIIDEALSEVDESLEVSIIKRILDKYKDKTIIYVSHKNIVKCCFKKVIDLERSV